MNILYFGDDSESSTSFHRACALKRLGHKVLIYNPGSVGQRKCTLTSKFHFHTGYIFLQNNIGIWIKANDLKFGQPDLIWVNGGEYFSTNALRILRKYSCPIILYNNDDPTGGRDGNRFNSLLKAIPLYDLCVVMRAENVQEYYAKGAKSVLRLMMSYDELMHKPYDSVDEIPTQFKSEVAFIGTWMRHEKRDEFLLELIKQGLLVIIWGGRWQKSSYWDELKKYYRGGSLGGRDYVAAIQGAKVCLGFLSKGNRDLHTTRTMEIPYAGGLFCAERTSEHLELYKEGVEAVYWSDVDECARMCKKLLADEVLREDIRLAGMKRVRELGLGHEDICRRILNKVESL